MAHPLILIPHAGGTAEVFDGLVSALSGDVAPVVLELPGRGRRWREKPITEIDAAVDWLEEHAAGVGDEFAVLGHSLGAYLGLRLAARVERQRGAARCTTLFASSNAGPARALLPMDRSPLDMTDDEIIDVAERTGGVFDTAVMSHPQLRRRVADLLRADFALSYGFLTSSRSTVTEADVVVCCGRNDIFTDEQLEAWASTSTGSTVVHRFDGGHFYLRNSAAELAGLVRRTLPLQPSPERAALPSSGGRR